MSQTLDAGLVLDPFGDRADRSTASNWNSAAQVSQGVGGRAGGGAAPRAPCVEAPGPVNAAMVSARPICGRDKAGTCPVAA